MSVLDRAALEESPLADLHTIASELSLDGYRRLRKAELIDAILGRQGGDASTVPPDADSGAAAEAEVEVDADADADAMADADADADADAKAAEDQADDEQTGTRRRRSRRGGRARTNTRDDDAAKEDEPAGEAERQDVERPELAPRSRTRSRSRDRDPERPRDQERSPDQDRSGDSERSRESEPSAGDEDVTVEGVVELLPNGSGFVRVQPPEPSDEDVYVSAAQVKRCELVSGDRVTGPRRAPRRSERFASLIRVDTINGGPASELGTRFDDLPAAFASERFRLGSEDPTVKAIEWLTPFGKGSRVTLVGPSRSGKSEALRRLVSVLAGQEELQVSIALAGVRPEEIGTWNEEGLTPVSAVSFAASSDAQDHAIELVIDQARRVAGRGADAVVLIDTLDGMHPQAARKALAAARNIVDGGSLTVIATASAPIGGETTVIALNLALASTGRFPALDLVASGTLRPELLVGDAGAEAIARARGEALDG